MTASNTWTPRTPCQGTKCDALSCPTLDDSDRMPRQDRYECEYVDDKGRARDMSLLVASGDKVWLYDHQGKPLKEKK